MPFIPNFANERNNLSMFSTTTYRLFSAALLFVSSFSAIGQSSDEWIERGVRKYNAFQDWTDTVTNISNKQTYIQAALNELKLIQADLNEARGAATMSQIQVIDYFDMNSIYTLGFLYGKLGEQTQSISYLRQVEQRMNKFSESNFPLRYQYDTKNYTINYSNFEPTRMEFYVAFSELLINKAFYDEAKVNLNKALAFTYKSDFLRYLSYDLYMRIHMVEPLPDLKCLEYGTQAMMNYMLLDSQTRTNLEKNNNFYFFSHRESILKALKTQTTALNTALVPYAQDAVVAAEWFISVATTPAEKLEGELFIAECYHAILNCGEMHIGPVRDAYNYFKSNDPSNTQELNRGLAILGTVYTDCADLRWVANEYASMNNPLFADTFNQKAENCENEKAQQEKEAAEKEAALKRQEERSYRRNNRDYFFFAGLNIFPLFGPEPDHGVAVNFGSNKFILELSGLQVNKKKENFFDLDLREVDDVQDHYWDGHFAHVNFKFTNDDWDDGRGGYYAGFLFAHNQRTFEPFESRVTNITTANSQLVTFSPTSQQYIFMFNYGAMGARILGIDMFMGFGAAYNTFNGNDTKYWRNPDFIIEDQMMQYRVKNYWSFTMRMGVSIGIGWGN